MLTQERLRQLLHYDPETGIFTRLVNSGTAKAGDVAGTRQRGGYVLISVDGTQYLAHRLAWLYETGSWPAAHTDHRDGDKANNRFANLREATSTENGRNRSRPRDNTSGAKGVYWSRRRCKWVAQISDGRKVINLGGFNEIADAVAARRAAEAEIYGEFACQRH